MKPSVILAPHWRRVDELFSREAFERLNSRFELVWARDESMPKSLLERAIPSAMAYVSSEPELGAAELARAGNLKAVIEVSGAFPTTIDYRGCAEKGIEVLSCAPGFQRTVAEMALAMMLAGARGLVNEHERFRHGTERWLSDNPGEDFSLFGASIGFIGMGSIAREIVRLLAPFSPTISAYDPWLDAGVADGCSVTLAPLEDVLSRSRCVVVAAAPSTENYQLLNAKALDMLPLGALVVVISRAHLVDLPVLIQAAESARIRLATDVFEEEPVRQDDAMRSAKNCIFSPHRAAAVAKGRQLIGDMIVDDLEAIAEGKSPKRLQRVSADAVARLAGVGSALADKSLLEQRVQTNSGAYEALD